MPGTLFIVTAPSGAGKTTLVSGLLERDPLVKLSISYTTRAPRAGEEDGRHYHFVDVPAFRQLRDKGEFLEWAEVHNNYYGTSKGWLEAQIRAVGILDLDDAPDGSCGVTERHPGAGGGGAHALLEGQRHGQAPYGALREAHLVADELVLLSPHESLERAHGARSDHLEVAGLPIVERECRK